MSNRALYRLVIALLPIFFLGTALTQTECFRTCVPNPSSPTYGTNAGAQFKPENARGTGRTTNPAQKAGAATAILGSQSYTYAIPILHLPGRAGFDLDLTLYYNSAVWTYNPANNSVTFNADHDWPSYGFRLDFGLLEATGDYFLIEPDGTKHDVSNNTDSSYINLAIGTPATITYKNGMQVLYQLFPSTQVGQAPSFLRPIQINDTNGNYITITYVSGTDQQINTITDTLGRVVQFNYNSNGNLSSITSNNSARTWAAFTWNTAYSLSYNFSATVDDSPANGALLNVLTGITFPNGTGYTFSYGAWGIVNQITNVSNSSQARSYQSYNYPGTGAALAQPPTYTQETVFDGATSRTWGYSSTISNNLVSQSTITDPSGTAAITNLYTASGDWKDGLVSSVQMKDSGGHLLREFDNTWTSDANTNANPRLSSLLTTLSDTGQQSRVDFLGYDAYGNVTDQKEYDFGLTLKREIVTAYSTAYTSSHILDLPSQAFINDASGNHISRMDYAYDGGSLTSTITGAANHNDSYSGSRANLTSVTRYTDPVGGTGGISRSFAYDSLGNLVTAQLDCCNQKQWNFSSATQYAYPDSVARGPSGLQLTTSASYNLDTGTTATSTDENGQVTTYQYDSSNRISTVTRPDSIVLTYAYDDADVSPSVSTSNSANSAIQKTVLDGLSRTLQQQLLNGTTLVSSRDTQYDDINNKIKNSNPYSTGETQLWTTTQLDALGRVTQITPPSGGSYQYQYSGNTTLVTDPAGLMRRSFVDYAGRLVEADEPGPGPNNPGSSGSGAITISGSLFSSTTSGTKATGWFTVSGADTWVYACEANPQLECNPNPRLNSKIWDHGSVSATINGVQGGASYSQNSTDAGLASTIASGLSPVTYTSNGAGTINVTANVPGPNYSMSGSSSTGDPTDFSGASFSVQVSGPTLTGGVYPVTTYDSGTLTVTVNGFQASASYNQNVNNTAAAMAQALANALNASGSPVKASLSGTTITLTAKTIGASTNYTVTGSSTASFAASSTTLSGGTDPAGIYAPYQTLYTYWPTGELAQVSEGVQTRTYNYDGLGRLTSFALPEDGTTNFTYTDFGATNTRTDARGVVTTYSYDGLHRLTSVGYNVGSTGVPATPTVSYTYGASASSNNNGRLLTMTDGPGSETYSYDRMGRITQTSRIINGVNYNIGFGYNAAGELSSLTYPSGRVVASGYDAIGRLTQISSGTTNYLSGVAYNSAQLTTGFAYGNNVQASFGYNDHLQLASLAYTSGSNTLLSLAYNYGTANNGQIQGITDNRGVAFSTSYTYDPLGRLSQAQTTDLTSANTWKLAWSYDRYGNRLNQTLTGGTASVGQPQLTVDPTTNHITNTGFAYDSSGDLINDGSHSYTYNGEGEITQVGATASYAYDGHRWRIQKMVNGTTTVYVYSGSKVIAEYPSGGVASAPNLEYIYSGPRLVATVAGSSITYHHPDHLSNRVETSSSGAVARTYGQLPFGDSWYETGITDKWKFTVYERDSAESGLDYAMNRFYSSAFGRFQSPDFLAGHQEDPQSLNRYSYVLNDPVNLVDRLGLGPCASSQTGADFCVAVNKPFLPGSAGGGDPNTGIPLTFKGGKGGGGGAPGGLGKIANSNLLAKDKCKAFFDALAKMKGISTDALVSQLQKTAADAQNFVYDGPSSETPLTEDKFPNASGNGAIKTVGELFDFMDRLGNHVAALSQFNGAAIFIDTTDWFNGSNYLNSSGQATGYGLGLLTHELLHKQMVGGGFSHHQMDQALDDAGAPGAISMAGIEASRIAQICF